MADITHGTWIKDGKAVDAVYQNGVKVYGRNLLTGTSGDLQTKHFTNSWNSGPQSTNGNWEIELFKGQTYMYRAWLDNTNGPNNTFVNARFVPIEGGDYNLGNGTAINQGETGYSTLQITPTEDGHALFTTFAYGSPQTYSAVWKEEKLETGNIPTPWTPAPEDILN